MENEGGISFNQTCAGGLIIGLILLILIFSGLGSFLRNMLTPASIPSLAASPTPEQSMADQASSAQSPTIPELSADQRQALIQTVSRNIQIHTNPDDNSQPLAFVLEAQTGAPIRSVAMNQDESLLAVGLENGAIVVWTLSSLNSNGQVAVQILAEHIGAVSSLVFDRQNNQRLASGAADTTIKLWDINGGHSIATLTGHTDQVFALAYIPNNPILASGSADSTIKLWDANTGRELTTMQGHTEQVFSLAIDSSASRMISGGADNQIIVWDLATQRSIVNLAGHNDWVSGLTFLPLGNQLASVSYDKTARIWTLTPPQAVQLLLEPTPGSALISVSAHPSGKLLALAASANNIYLWNINAAAPMALPDQTLTAVTALAFSPQGNFLAAGSQSGAIRLWRTHAELIN
ncbi:MAG: WD40 repeat domain-containing protein [Caldilineaceae bacterium]